MRWFINLTTRTKLALGFGLMVVLFLIAVGAAFFFFGALRESDRLASDVLTVRSNLNTQRAVLVTSWLAGGGSAQETRFQEIARQVQDNDALLLRLQQVTTRDARLDAALREFVSLRQEFGKTRDAEVIPLIRAQKIDEARALIAGIQEERFTKITDLGTEISEQFAARADAAVRQVRAVCIIAGLVVLATGLSMIFGFSRLIADPLANMTTIADRISRGDLNIEFPAEARRDEVGQLAQTFQRMTRFLKVLVGRATQIAGGDLTVGLRPQSEADLVGNAFTAMSENLRRLMQDLVETVNVLGASASDIMASTAQLAASAAETATAVAQTTTTVEEVKQTSQISSQKAKFVSEKAQKVADVSESGRRSVVETISGMNGIRQQMSVVAESIMSLSAQGQAIGEIVATVDDLAAQSKLLAVNASIEAAKAGEEGKGFSVVAQEVRTLAEQSKQATAQVRGILNEIQKATSTAVLATEHASKSVEQGVRQATAAGDSIGALADNVNEAAQAATQIAAASQEQFVGMDQVALAMKNIKEASTQTVASTRQAEAAAQQLHELGTKLKGLVDRFKV